jgi:hypothetical protein
VTTTGGRGDVDLGAPDLGPTVLGSGDGDDITVIPSEPEHRSRGRMRAFLVAAIVAVLAAAGITVAVVNRDDTDASSLRSVSRVDPTPAPTTDKPAVVKPTTKKPPASVPAKATPPTTPAVVAPAGPPPVTPTAPPPTTPRAYPPSVLTWQATPAAFTIESGGHATLTVTVTNPTDGTVTLGRPVSCPPTLQSEHGGAPFGGGVCVQMAQVMSTHQSLTQPYTIYATSTGDASGKPLAAGRYRVRVENLHSFWLTVTAS